jgi:ABC-type glycerol-3-phosphate transport system permease component
VIILYTVAQLPFATAMFQAFFDGIPRDLEAAASLAMLPTFVLFLFIQKYMMYGAIGSGVKG